MLKRIEVARNDQPPPKEDPSPTKDVPSLSVEELAAQIANGSGVQIVDARQRDHMSRHVDLMAGATWRDPDRVEEWITELTPDTPVAVYCSYGFDVGSQRDEDAHRARLRATLHPRRASAWYAAGGARAMRSATDWITRTARRSTVKSFTCCVLIAMALATAVIPCGGAGDDGLLATAQGRKAVSSAAHPEDKSMTCHQHALRSHPFRPESVHGSRPVSSSTRPARSRVALNGLPGGLAARRSRILMMLAAIRLDAFHRKEMSPPSTICSPPMVARMVPPSSLRRRRASPWPRS